MNRTIFEGSADFASTLQKKSSCISRLEKNGKLDNMLVSETISGISVLFHAFGYVCLIAGVFLLIGGLINIPHIT